jgi:DNA-binding NarL/FixJ family response regulator
MKLRIVLADDNRRFLAMFSSLLGTEFDIVATASDGKSALEHIQALQPDVAILDLEMPMLNGIEVARVLMAHTSPPAIVICSVETDVEIVQAALDAGARGYVYKSRIATDLLAAVRAAARGESFVSSP